MEDTVISPGAESMAAEPVPTPAPAEPAPESSASEEPEANPAALPPEPPAEDTSVQTGSDTAPTLESPPEENTAAPEQEPAPGTDAIVRIAEEAKETAALYPAFDLKAEMEDPRFSAMVFQGVPVRQAYQALHMDDILADAMHYAAERTRELLVNHLQAGAARPAENGAAGRQPASHSFDPRSMTPEQSRDLRERVYRGEKIYL